MEEAKARGLHCGYTRQIAEKYTAEKYSDG